MAVKTKINTREDQKEKEEEEEEEEEEKQISVNSHHLHGRPGAASDGIRGHKDGADARCLKDLSQTSRSQESHSAPHELHHPSCRDARGAPRYPV